MDQYTLLRRLSGRARLEQAFKLSDFVRELSVKKIQSEKRCSPKQSVRELMKRMYGVEIIKGNVVRVTTSYLHLT